MDKLETRLLGILELEGFQTGAVLARKLGVGRSTVYRQINSMRKSGMIKVIAVPDRVKLGYRGWAGVWFNVDRASLYSVTHKLVQYDEVHMVAHSVGQFDIITAVHLESWGKLACFVNSELGRKWVYYQNMSALTASELDDIDRRILGVLREDALIPHAVIAARLGIAESTVQRRIKSMLSRELFKIGVVCNPQMLPYEAWALIGVTTSGWPVHELINNMIKNPAVYFISECLGRFSILMTARFHSMDLLYNFVKVELQSLEGVTSATVLPYNRIFKHNGTVWQLPAENH